MLSHAPHTRDNKQFLTLSHTPHTQQTIRSPQSLATHHTAISLLPPKSTNGHGHPQPSITLSPLDSSMVTFTTIPTVATEPKVFDAIQRKIVVSDKTNKFWVSVSTDRRTRTRWT